MQQRYYTDWSRVPLLLDMQQAAVLLQITPEHLRKLCRTGKFPAMQVGSGWRISREAIQQRIETKGA